MLDFTNLQQLTDHNGIDKESKACGQAYKHKDHITVFKVPDNTESTRNGEFTLGKQENGFGKKIPYIHQKLLEAKKKSNYKTRQDYNSLDFLVDFNCSNHKHSLRKCKKLKGKHNQTKIKCLPSEVERGCNNLDQLTSSDQNFSNHLVSESFKSSSDQTSLALSSSESKDTEQYFASASALNALSVLSSWHWGSVSDNGWKKKAAAQANKKKTSEFKLYELMSDSSEILEKCKSSRDNYEKAGTLYSAGKSLHHSNILTPNDTNLAHMDNDHKSEFHGSIGDIAHFDCKIQEPSESIQTNVNSDKEYRLLQSKSASEVDRLSIPTKLLQKAVSYIFNSCSVLFDSSSRLNSEMLVNLSKSYSNLGMMCELLKNSSHELENWLLQGMTSKENKASQTDKTKKKLPHKKKEAKYKIQRKAEKVAKYKPAIGSKLKERDPISWWTKPPESLKDRIDRTYRELGKLIDIKIDFNAHTAFANQILQIDKLYKQYISVSGGQRPFRFLIHKTWPKKCFDTLT